MRTMSVVDVSMKIWASEHPSLTKCFSLLQSTFDPNLQTYTLRMEYKDACGNKCGVAKVVDAQTLKSARYPHHYICSLLDEMFGGLVDSKLGTARKEKEMGNNCVKADNDVRLKMAKAAVVAWYNEHNAPATIGMEDVYIVWFSKVLQNWKALAGTHHGDGMYYEVTYDGDKDCAYVDAYKKWQNVQMDGCKLREGIC